MPVAQWAKREKWAIRELEKSGFDRELIHCAFSGGSPDWEAATSELSEDLADYLIELREGRARGRGARASGRAGETAIKAFAARCMRRFTVNEKPCPKELVDLVDYLFELDKPPPGGPYSDAKRRDKAISQLKKQLAVALLLDRNGEISNSELARACATSTKTVSSWRRPPVDSGDNFAIVDRDFLEELEALKTLPTHAVKHFIKAHQRALNLG